jgi:adenosylcobinamide-GDP ribazoletransferase
MQSSWTDWIKTFGPALRHQILCFFAAFRFLTIIPVHWQADQDSEYFRESLPYFPLLGALIGVCVGILTLFLRSFFPGTIVAVSVLILLAGVSGCLHLDGLADTADGFFSSRPRERILAIMKDSRTGAMGVIAIVMVLLVKFAALVSLPAPVFLKTAFLMPIAGRCAIVLSMAILPYAREEGGLGSLFYTGNCRMSVVWCLLSLIVLFPFAGLRTMLILFFTMIAVVLLFSAWCRSKIGGATGDTLGAVCELTEMAVAVVMSGTI